MSFTGTYGFLLVSPLKAQAKGYLLCEIFLIPLPIPRIMLNTAVLAQHFVHVLFVIETVRHMRGRVVCSPLEFHIQHASSVQ